MTIPETCLTFEHVDDNTRVIETHHIVAHAICRVPHLVNGRLELLEFTALPGEETGSAGYVWKYVTVDGLIV